MKKKLWIFCLWDKLCLFYRYSNSSYVNMLNYEQKSLPGSVMSWASRGSHQWSEPPYRQRCSLDANANTSRNSSFLMVPGVRLSSTGSSSDSSYYLEHRSLMELGLPPLVRNWHIYSGWKKTSLFNDIMTRNGSSLKHFDNFLRQCKD